MIYDVEKLLNELRERSEAFEQIGQLHAATRLTMARVQLLQAVEGARQALTGEKMQ